MYKFWIILTLCGITPEAKGPLVGKQIAIRSDTVLYVAEHPGGRKECSELGSAYGKFFVEGAPLEFLAVLPGHVQYGTKGHEK